MNNLDVPIPGSLSPECKEGGSPQPPDHPQPDHEPPAAAALQSDPENLAPDVPIIYTRFTRPAPMTRLNRLAAGLTAMACLTLLAVAASLNPSAAGYGTHLQLGLAPCAFMQRTGLPCPSCGFTTAFSYFAHGRPIASFITQPMGSLLAWVTAITVWVGFYVALTGRPVHRLFKLLPSRYYLMPVLLFALAAWGWKIVTTLMRPH